MSPSSPEEPIPSTRNRRTRARTKFRFKSKAHRSRSRSRSRSPTSSHTPHDRHSHHHHHRTRNRRRTSPNPTPSSAPDPFRPRSLTPETAFRESLFDALADDEGAAFWESVYGQPIHGYARPSTVRSESAGAGNTSEEAAMMMMDDEEYAAYVRAKMWEKTHQHVLEERTRRDAERARREKAAEEARRWERGVEEALRRGEERRCRKRWREAWDRYLSRWEEFLRSMDEEHGDGRRALRKYIPWPVLSGREEDVGKEAVERFFRNHAALHKGEGEEEGGLERVLKLERVRWHPDKMQQRAGKEGIDGETMKTITAVFQVVDGMWLQAKRS